MKAERQEIYRIIIGELLFNRLFGYEKMAVNTDPYVLFLPGVLFFFYPKTRHSSAVRWLLTSHLICLAMIKNRQRTIKQIRDMYISVRANYNWAIH